jgi:hypothetical protein
VERANLAAKEDKMSVMQHLTAALFWLQDQTTTCSEIIMLQSSEIVFILNNPLVSLDYSQNKLYFLEESSTCSYSSEIGYYDSSCYYMII